MILITIDNNKDFTRLKVNRSRAYTPIRRRRSLWERLFGTSKRARGSHLIPPVLK